MAQNVHLQAKFIIQIYKHDTIILFDDEDWQDVVSNLRLNIEPILEVEVQPSPDVKME